MCKIENSSGGYDSSCKKVSFIHLAFIAVQLVHWLHSWKQCKTVNELSCVRRLLISTTIWSMFQGGSLSIVSTSLMVVESDSSWVWVKPFPIANCSPVFTARASHFNDSFVVYIKLACHAAILMWFLMTKPKPPPYKREDPSVLILSHPGGCFYQLSLRVLHNSSPQTRLLRHSNQYKPRLEFKHTRWKASYYWRGHHFVFSMRIKIGL